MKHINKSIGRWLRILAAARFSLLHASYGRPEKAMAAMRMALERASQSDHVEYIFACNADDPSYAAFKDALALHFTKCASPAQWPKMVWGNFVGSASAWNAAANASTGEILIQMQDDLELPQDWDQLLMNAITNNNGRGIPAKTSPLFVSVSDGYRKDALCCTAIMNRARYTQQGEFLHPGYISVFSDDDVTYRALRDARDEKCTFVNARDLTFLHRHHYHDKSVPMDATYERENSAEAYAAGGALFASRNPLAATDGIRTWG